MTGFFLDEGGDLFLCELSTVKGKDGSEALLVIHAEVLLIVFLFCQGNPLLRENFLECLEMKGLGVCDDTVKIKNNGPKRMSHPFSAKF